MPQFEFEALPAASIVGAPYLFLGEFKPLFTEGIPMNRFYLVLAPLLFCILAVTSIACSAGNQQQSQPEPSDTRVADESAIRALDADWQGRCDAV